jgi:hypothetical protein
LAGERLGGAMRAGGERQAREQTGNSQGRRNI